MTLSRIVPVIVLACAVWGGGARADDSAAALIANTDTLYAVSDDECESGGREIVVCALHNENDRYRLPFETIVAGDPDNEGVWAERERLQANPGTCQRAAYFQVGCGAVGVSVGIGGPNAGIGLGGLRRVGQ